VQAGHSRRPEKVPTTAVALGLDAGLIAAAAARYEAETGEPATTRNLIGWATDKCLPRLTDDLRRLGFRGAKVGKRRPRRIKQATWNALQAASDASGLPASVLLRACLQQIKDLPKED
jgi:hypothetical protein